MASLVSWAAYDFSGVPLAGLSPSFVDYCDRNGNARTQPTILALGGGLYGFVPTDTDESTGSVYIVDNGALALQRRMSGPVTTAALPFTAWHLEQDDGSLWAGAAPTISIYARASGPVSAPSVVAARTYLFSVTPTAPDATAGISFFATSPPGASPAYAQDVLVANAIAGNISASPGVTPATLAVNALREYLLRYLPAKCTQLNALRVATLKAALVGPYTVPSGAVLKLSSNQESTPTNAPLTSGVRTAAQVAADVTAAAVPGWTASDDGRGALQLINTAVPAAGAPSCVLVRSDTTNANAVFGWADGGEHVEVPALVSPSWRGVVDGRPLTAPDMGQGFWVMLGNRTVRPTHPGIRRDTWNVTFAVDIWRPFSANAPPHRTREAIASCVRAVRELVEAGDGRYLGRQGANDIALVTITDESINGDPLVLNEVPGVMFDVARLTLNVRVFQRPD